MGSATQIVPALELKGSSEERVKTLDNTIADLQRLRSTLIGDAVPAGPPYELHGRYLNAPVWPWFIAGWVVGALFVLFFVLAWTWA